MRSICIRIAVAGLITTVGSAATQSQQVERARGCAYYESGLSFMSDRKYQEALEDFKKAVDGCPQVVTQAQALLLQGSIYLNQSPPSFADARRVANMLTNELRFFETPSGPDGLILLGLIELREARNFEGAQNQFKRVGVEKLAAPREARAQAQYWTAETYRIAHQPEEALRVFQEVTLRFPATPWKARALLGAASCYVQMDDLPKAMEALQRVRRDFPTDPEADLALKRNTILHRMMMRGRLQESQPPVALGPGRLREGAGLAIDAAGRVILGYKDGLAVLPSAKATAFQTRTLDQPDKSPTAVGLGPYGVIALAREQFLTLDREKPEFWYPAIPQKEGNPEPVEVQAVTTKWNGEWLIADGKSNAILRFSPANGYLGTFAENVAARRMIRNDIDDVAIVNGRTRGITIFGRDGGAPREIPRRLQGTYEWDNASDIAFDGLGNLYVLDGSKSVIHLFDSGLRFRTTIQLPLKGQVQLKKAHALVVDESGRIFVLDRDGQQVLAYQ